MSTITSEFTNEQLIAKAREQIAFCRNTKITGEGRTHVNQCSALFEIELASLEAEIHSFTFEEDPRPLYTAPPAPVSVPDEQCKPHPVMAVKGELGFLDHFDRIISERDEDIDIGQLGSSNYEALMLAALDAFRAAMLHGADGNSPVIPDGYTLVPVEPTYQMCEAMDLPWERPRFPDRYKAMLAAAPVQEAK